MINVSIFYKPHPDSEGYSRLPIKMLQAPQIGEHIHIIYPDCTSISFKVFDVSHEIYFSVESKEFEQTEVTVFAKQIEVKD
jgi:hypothetical protein